MLGVGISAKSARVSSALLHWKTSPRRGSPKCCHWQPSNRFTEWGSLGKLGSSVDKFVAVRRLSGCPVTVVNPEMHPIRPVKIVEHADRLMEDARALYERYEHIMRLISRTLPEDRITL